ncbi:hypothetical protein MMC24_002966 [Lignoscripta atroalba]|nr:hypothetical protein [Lignoscripta atroalba]
MLASVLPVRLHVTSDTLLKHAQLLLTVYDGPSPDGTTCQMNPYSACAIIIDSSSLALEFFGRIGLEILGLIKNIRIHIEKATILHNPDALFRPLQYIASCAPARLIRDVPLSFARQPPIVVKAGKCHIGYPSFALHGLLGLKLRIAVQHAQDEAPISLAEMESLLGLNRANRPRVNFLRRLPPEMRHMIYSYLTPSLCLVKPSQKECSHAVTGTRYSRVKPEWLQESHGDCSPWFAPWDFENLMLVCHQMTTEVEEVIYKTCKFRYVIIHSRENLMWQVLHPLSHMQLFLQTIGSRHALLLQDLELMLDIDYFGHIEYPLRPVVLLLASTRLGHSVTDTDSMKIEIFNALVPQFCIDNLRFTISTIPGLNIILRVRKHDYRGSQRRGEISVPSEIRMAAFREILQANLNGERMKMDNDGIVREDGKFTEPANQDEISLNGQSVIDRSISG